MIFLRISSRDEDKMEQIATLLLEEKLVIDVNIKRGLERLTMKNGVLVKTKICLLTAKTKSLLFSTIDQRLKKEFPEKMPELYALPIVNMDWEQSKELSEVVKLV